MLNNKDTVNVMADNFNENEACIQKCLEYHNYIAYIPTTGGASLRSPQVSKLSTLDHFVGSKNFLRFFNKPQVLKTLSTGRVLLVY